MNRTVSSDWKPVKFKRFGKIWPLLAAFVAGAVIVGIAAAVISGLTAPRSTAPTTLACSGDKIRGERLPTGAVSDQLCLIAPLGMTDADIGYARRLGVDAFYSRSSESGPDKIVGYVPYRRLCIVVVSGTRDAPTAAVFSRYLYDYGGFTLNAISKAKTVDLAKQFIAHYGDRCA